MTANAMPDFSAPPALNTAGNLLSVNLRVKRSGLGHRSQYLAAAEEIAGGLRASASARAITSRFARRTRKPSFTLPIRVF